MTSFDPATNQPSGESDGDTLVPEEAWELEIAALLGGLDAVEPPEGAIARALDHRPLFAGRTAVLAGAAAVVAVVAAVGAGVFERSAVVPAVADLAERHSAAEAGVLGSVVPLPDSDDVTFEVIDDTTEPIVELPEEFERKTTVAADQVEQAIYAAGDETVSVFSEPGTADFESLPAEGLRTIGGLSAWVDDEQSMVIVQAKASVVTIVGLNPSEVGELLAEHPELEASTMDRVAGWVNQATSQLGFPDLR